MSGLARDIVATRPDVVFAVSEVAIRPVLEADANIPVVMSFMGSDPVEAGLASSISRPGGHDWPDDARRATRPKATGGAPRGCSECKADSRPEGPSASSRPQHGGASATSAAA